MAAAAAITTTIQSLPFTLTGYCGIMLPVCEDYRLSEIQAGEGRKYTVSHLMNVSSVCGVGVDTVPIPKDVRFEEVAGVILDICGLAARWNKPLSVRMFPVPDLGEGGEKTLTRWGYKSERFYCCVALILFFNRRRDDGIRFPIPLQYKGFQPLKEFEPPGFEPPASRK